MSLPYNLDDVRRYPSMCLPRASFDAAAAFLLGVDAACGKKFLEGFREWLVPRVGYGDNVSWPGLVLDIASSSFDPKNPPHPPSGCGDDPAIECLFHCLEEFLCDKEQAQGLDNIHKSYRSWLKTQKWFTPSSPRWFEDGDSKD